MPAANQPKGSVSAGSIKPVTRKAVRCQREVAWLVTQAAGKLVATTDDVNAPTPSFVLAAALSYTRKQEQTAQDRGTAVDYKAVMGPDLANFCAAAGLPAAPNALSDAGYMFTPVSMPSFLQKTWISSMAGAPVPSAKYQQLVSTTSTPAMMAESTEASP